MTSYETHFDVPYPDQSHPRQALDLYLPPGSSPESPLVVHIHGGAWRAEAKSDIRDTLAPRLVEHTGHPVAVLEYRLAPSYTHPAQINDVLAGLALLASAELLPAEGGAAKWDRRKLYLTGHSAGAFMASTVVLDPPGTDTMPVTREFDVPAGVREAVAGAVLVDGIFDLVDLINEYPTYDGFVNEAFTLDKKRLTAESPSNWVLPTPGPAGASQRPLRLLVLHSREDELLTLRQPEVFVKNVRRLLEGQGEGRGSLEVDYDSLRDSHDNLIKREELPKAVADWVKRIEGN